MPDLRVSGYYKKIMDGASEKDKDYLIDKLRGAEFLIKSINKRRKTIQESGHGQHLEVPVDVL